MSTALILDMEKEEIEMNFFSKTKILFENKWKIEKK